MENIMDNLEALTINETQAINGGGLYEQCIRLGARFLVGWHAMLEKQQQSGSSGMEFMGGA
jgi:hypothetical protein